MRTLHDYADHTFAKRLSLLDEWRREIYSRGFTCGVIVTLLLVLFTCCWFIAGTP